MRAPSKPCLLCSAAPAPSHPKPQPAWGALGSLTRPHSQSPLSLVCLLRGSPEVVGALTREPHSTGDQPWPRENTWPAEVTEHRAAPAPATWPASHRSAHAEEIAQTASLLGPRLELGRERRATHPPAPEGGGAGLSPVASGRWGGMDVSSSLPLPGTPRQSGPLPASPDPDGSQLPVTCVPGSCLTNRHKLGD